MIPPTIADYYRAALEELREEVQSTTDDRAIGMDTERWVRYLVAKYGMEPIEANLAAIRMKDTTRNDYPAVLVFVPVEVTDSLENHRQARPGRMGAWLGFDYKAFFSDGPAGTIGQIEQPEGNHINTARRRITEYVQSLNNAISYENKTFAERVRQIVMSKIAISRER